MDEIIKINRMLTGLELNDTMLYLLVYVDKYVISCFFPLFFTKEFTEP